MENPNTEDLQKCHLKVQNHYHLINTFDQKFFKNMIKQLFLSNKTNDIHLLNRYCQLRIESTQTILSIAI